MFRDRKEAGQKLAEVLERFRGTESVVIALPRGGVVVGYEVARALALPLDIIAIRKIGAPSAPEYAIGAVDEHGTTLLNEAETREVGEEWLRDEIARQQVEAGRRSALYSSGKGHRALLGKTVIIVDDGIATGFTMRLAVRAVEAQQAEKIIVAVPIAPEGMAETLKAEGAAEVIELEAPERFMGSVGAHYELFDQVEDDEVIHLMHSL